MSAPVTGFLRLAASGPVVRRACFFAVVVGAVLVAINHGPAMLAGDLDGGRIAQMILTVCVPYAVSTISSVLAIRELERRD